MYDFESIRERIKSYLENPTSKIEGTFSMDHIGAVSQELARIIAMEVLPIPDTVLLDTATNDYLDRRAIDFNETRTPAEKATGLLQFEGDENTIIPIKTVVGYHDLRFETTESGVIENGIATVFAQCMIEGTIGNIEANSIDNCISTITGISAVTNLDIFMGGVDLETDDSLRNRILEKIQKPITSGNKNHYIYWAKQVSGVGEVRVISCWNGNGTVKVIVLSSEGDVPDDVIIENVANYIEENRPIGAEVTVAKAIPVFIDIEVELSFSTSYTLSVIKEEIKRAITTYLGSIAFVDETVLSYYKIGDIIFDVSGVLDIFSYTINGDIFSITPQFEEFFVLNEVVINGN